MTTMPSVLTETGFITDPTEEKYLNSKEGQDKIALSIFTACNEYINEIDSKSIIFSGRNNNPQPEEIISPLVNPPSAEIMFMVQISTSSSQTEIKPENFKGLKEVSEINAQNRFKYAIGRFNEYSEAVNYRKNIEYIYPDAFVIAVKDNKILPLQQALEEKKKK
jgi:N-acetylmuramoyl-L-alanine amidase